MHIRVRLVLYAVAVATAGMLLFGVLLSTLARGGVAEDQDAALGRLADALAVAITEAGPELLSGREPLVAPDPRTDDAAFLLVTDGVGVTTWSGALLDGSPIRVPAAVVVEAFEVGRSVATTRPDGTLELRMVAVPWVFGDAGGVVVAAQPLRVLGTQVEALEGFLLIAGVVTILAVGIVSWLVVGRALRPLRTLSRTTDAITRTGDLSGRLPEVRARDEVGTLSRSFNAMLDRLAASQAGLAASLEAQRRMVADASHELRTPLTTIRTNAETLRAHPDADATERAEAVADIADEAQRMSRLLGDLLLLARADAGGDVVAGGVRRAVDLAAIAGEVARRATRPDRPVTLEHSGPLMVQGDADALTRLVWILVDNALVHGAGEVTVATGIDPDAVPAAWLTVADRGPGFASGDEARAFDRFWQADRARSGSGTGLGLAIARSIAEAHAGTVVAVGRDGGGALLTVRLPSATTPGSGPA